MKNFTLTAAIFLFLIPTLLHAQWTGDPDAPITVSAESFLQSGVRSFEDGAGGIFIFWFDSRTGNSQWDIYGQHYNSDGVAQWEEGGREIVNYEGRVYAYNVLPADANSIMIIWSISHSTVAAENGVYARRMDANAEPLWNSDLKLRNDSSYPNSLSTLATQKVGDNFIVGSGATVIGGSNQMRLMQFDMQGNLIWPFDGVLVSGMGGYGSFSITAAGDDGVYVYKSTGNSLGAGITCMLVSAGNEAINLWPAWTSVLAGTAGLNGGYTAIGDEDGMTLVWLGGGPDPSTGVNLYARRVLASNGSLGWNGDTKVICDASGNQSVFSLVKKGNMYYAAWSDGRPGVVGNYAIYANKFNINGVVLWAANGVEVANLNTYIPHTKVAIDDEDNLCITHKAGPGFMAQKLNPQGERLWPVDGVFALTNAFAPFYGDYNLVHSDGKFLVVSSKSVPSGGADNIYLNNIVLPPVEITEDVTACNEYSAYGELFTQSDSYTINLEDTIITLNLTIIENVAIIEQDGDLLYSLYDGDFVWIDCATGEPIEGETNALFTPLASGSYALQVSNGDCVSMSECFEYTLGGTTSTDNAENNLAFFNMYPNPGTAVLNIETNSDQSKVMGIAMYDTSGRRVLAQAACAHSACEVNTVDLCSGIYLVEVRTEEGIARNRWVKQ
jgi:hypothetical protein